ncbi:hypothetical protein [Pedobacter caeni]|uniref:Uncharacterized protein n=1 Tax=Pedobacter caeni TaxID=288992 RepID=A0A1M5BY52_9SPHI|nr:hypothetical protein [Pedobacter caeni]SHF47463.1 hypothetical protein SAMN04488522_1021409 [Pedobacter caeni]
MNKTLISLTIVAFATINQVKAQTDHIEHKVTLQQKSTKELKDIERAKAWLAHSVEDDLNKANGLAENTNEEAEGGRKQIYADKYIAYKNDAFEVGMEGKMTLKAFQKKWSKDFDCQYAGIGFGCLVPISDYGLIKVSRCIFTKKVGLTYVFETTITDTDAKIGYKRDIKVVPSGKAYLIEDVLEYN